MLSRENDPLWMLYMFYFVPCEVMYQHHQELKSQFYSEDEETQERATQEFMTFTMFWFATLFVVSEGWKELKVADAEINSLIDQHIDSLRLFRNAVYHFQKGDKKHTQFFDVEKFNWAEQMQTAYRRFFSVRSWYHG
jgi:hypothetical protein